MSVETAMKNKKHLTLFRVCPQSFMSTHAALCFLTAQKQISRCEEVIAKAIIT